MDNRIPLPAESCAEDLRRKLDLFELVCLIKSSLCYIGNDTGPLHIANLMKKSSISIYMKEGTKLGYSPNFAHLNTPVYKPENVDTVYSELIKVLSSLTTP
jgi:ADP-heptose:LPS heptosyltransferase